MTTLKIALILLASCPSPLKATASAADSISLPRISVNNLRSALSSDQSGMNLHQLIYDSHGVLRIAVDDEPGYADFSKLRKRALGHLCECPTLSSVARNHGDVPTFEEAAKSHPTDLQQITLPDGTLRRTLASATVGFDENVTRERSHSAVALELPSWVEDTCGTDAYNSLEELRDVVADVVDLFVSRLDQEKKQSTTEKIQEDGSGHNRSYRQILADANHLEHFHVYTKTTDVWGGNYRDELQLNGGNSMHGYEPSTLDYHTDAGFFLSFVPAMNCRSRKTDDSSFFLKGTKKPLAFEEDEVVIMMGAGAQYWLPPHDRSEEQGTRPLFLAASHALRLTEGTHRTWYGKMHLLPSTFTSFSKASPPLQYGAALPSFQLKKYDAHVPSSSVDGCGTNIFNQHSAEGMQKSFRRRRMQHVSSPRACNNQTNFFCWNQCIDIPNSELAEQYVQDGYSLYCLDPAALSSSNNPIQDATEPCEGGFVHNSHCSGSWQKTDANVPGYELPYEVKTNNNLSSTHSVSEVGDQYCYGGTSMYMEGFTWQDTTCVIYLFSSWVLTSPGKFAMAALGSILLGIALEFVLWKRRGVYSLPAGSRRLLLSTLIYGIQLAMGYLIMLVIMTYSGPLFISTVGGMMLGHLLFNAQDSLAKQWREKKSRTDMNGGTDRTSMNGDSSLEANSLFARRPTNSNAELNSYQHGSGGEELENTKLSPELETEKFSATENTVLNCDVADGATPCCQYTL